MGRRARRGGIANAALRRARAARDSKNAEARAIAQLVYVTATQIERDSEHDARPLGLPVLAPVMVAAENAVAGGMLDFHGLPTDDQELALDVAAYLVHGFRMMLWGFDREHFERWRHAQDGAARLPASD